MDSIPAEVVPGLFIGSVGSALSKKSLAQCQISDILSVMDKIRPFYAGVFTNEKNKKKSKRIIKKKKA